MVSRLSWITLTALFCALLLVGCVSSKPEPLRLGTNVWAGYEPLYLARELGLLDQRRVRLHELPSASEVMRAFRNGQLDAAALTLDEALTLLAEGQDLRIVLVLDVSNGADAVVAQPGISRLAELKGRRIGAETAALGAYMTQRMLDAAGLDKRDIHLVPLPVDAQEEAFSAGRVDAVVTFEPVRSRLLARGGRLLFDSSQIPDEIFDVLVVRGEAYRSRQDDLEHLRAAWFSALKALQSHPQEAERIMARRLGSEPAVAKKLAGLRLVGRAYETHLLSGTEPVLLSAARRLARIMVEARILDRAVDPAPLLGLSETEAR